VNLTDGLDGLAAGCLVCAAATIALLCFVVGDAAWSGYLGITHVPAAGEMAVIAAALVGGLLGFLWFNCHPASIFMGDAGSLPLGGLLGLLAVVARQELLLVTVGGVFVVETLSVMLQIASFRLFGRRPLRCAPLHHHFQLCGWSEDKIVVRFWIAGAICSIAALVTLRGPLPALRQAQRPAPAESQAHQELPRAAELF
jgi:phospho-N-acetylmuramoyl-pentapeptide-transferase